ncbi:hypothetical protein [Aliivibrio fischeri]|uniref:hypothetical protein n=1 Tax=Aliivibrio fischeri TaxID=668 RepID=UPI00080EA3F3|nr:hypothetical protein [Aliivibrio fischeri]OCH02207.1 hypothetical protein A6E10_17730 [Aliivibrio fischeri]
MAELQITDGLKELISSYVEFKKISECIDFTHMNTDKKLKDIHSLIQKVSNKIEQTIEAEVIVSPHVFISLFGTEPLLTRIYILRPHGDFPLKPNSLYKGMPITRSIFIDAANDLNNHVKACLIYSSYYLTGSLNNKVELLSKKIIDNPFQHIISSFEDRAEQVQILISNSQSEFDEYIRNISGEKNNSLKMLKTESISLTTEARSKLNEHRESIETQLELKQSDLSMTLESKVSEEINKKTIEIETIKKQAQAYYEQAKAESIAFRLLYEEMRTMYQIAGQGELQKYNLEQAQNEKSDADRLRVWGAIAMLLPISIALFIFRDLISETPPTIEFNWILTRFLTITILSMPMLYALKESANHRFKENLYRQRGTQLATLGSYLDDFTDEKEKMKIKSDLVKNFYSVNTGKADMSHIPDPNEQIKEVVALSKSLSKILPTQTQTQTTASTKEKKPQLTPPKNAPEEEQKETK